MTKQKLLALLLALALLLGLAACGGGAAPGTGSAVQSAAQSQPQQSEPHTPDGPELLDGQRDYRVVAQGGGADVVTVMLFMCGSDLESGGGAATNDIVEIISAGIADNVNIIIETGGSTEWQNDVVSSETNQRWQAVSDDLVHLEDVGVREMTDPETLVDFIRFCDENYPADRNILIFWDHGGGTLGGYGGDEFFPGEEMALDEIDYALGSAGVVFDWIGFDCCLMGTAETAFVMEKHADYFIGSQRAEPGGGWYYTDWVNALSANTSIPTPEIGQIIVDTFIREEKDGYYGEELTLAMLDLTFVPLLFEELYAYLESAQGALVDSGAFMEVSQARYQSRSPGEEDYDQVDLAYLTQNLPVGDASGLLEALDHCVVYSQETMDNYSGLSLYFPYSTLHYVDTVLGIVEGIGIDTTYRDFMVAFASLMAGGQMYAGGGNGGVYGGEMDWEGSGWVDEDLVGEYEDYYAENSYDASELYIEEKYDYYALSLSEEDWELITEIYLEVFFDIGDAHLHLGRDNVYEFDEDGDLIVQFDDNTWVALDGQIVAFYAVESGVENLWYGYVPAMLNDDTPIHLYVAWEGENSEHSYVMGYQHVYEGNTAARGLLELQDGDELTFIANCYSYDDEYLGEMGLGSLVVDGPITVSYEDVGDADCLIYYSLYDIYQNVYWTEALIYSMDW